MKKTILKKSLVLATSALTLSTAFVGCTDYNTFTEAELQHEAKLQEYYNNFVKEFGEPDPNHTWGWEGMTPELADAILGESATRASYNPGHDPETQPGYIFNPERDNQSGRILVNHNQWAEEEGSSGEYKSYAIARMVHIPGWPNEDGTYIANGSTTERNGKVFGTPKGDISEYEIQYVSWYMRNHPFNPASSDQSHLDLVDLHVSEFFIQQVSCDADYTSYSNLGTEKSMAYFGGGSNWGMDYLNFKALDGNWTHINNFNANQNFSPWKQSKLGNNNDRTMQYVMSSGTEDFNYHSSTSSNSYTFDKWVMVKIEWDEPRTTDWTQYTTQEELEAYLASNKDKSTSFHREGYYLCFDFQADKSDNNSTHPEMDYPGDNVYSNWILKITPGKQVQIDRWPKRLMCEDLGNTEDFDFNDAVFDLFFQENANKSGYYDCIVTLQAAGGTMPIWVAINPNNLPAGYSRETAEIHKLLGGYPSTTPVNVIKGGATAPFASYRVKEMFKIDGAQTMYKEVQMKDKEDNLLYLDSDGNITTTNTGTPVMHWVVKSDYTQSDQLLTKMAAAAFKLSIYVGHPSGMQEVSGYKIFQTLRDNTGNNGFNGGNKSTSIIPQLFNCSVDAKWTYENKHIKDAYKHFTDWVNEEQGAYRLRWDKTGYYKRTTLAGEQEESVGWIDNTTPWEGSWDFGPNGNTVWGDGGDTWFDKSLLYGAE